MCGLITYKISDNFGTVADRWFNASYYRENVPISLPPNGRQLASIVITRNINKLSDYDLTPFLAQFVKPRFRKVLERHCNSELTIRVEVQEKRF